MEIFNLLNASQGKPLESIFNYNKNSQEEQENKSTPGLSYSVNSDRVNISQEAMQLVAKSESGGQEPNGSGSAGGGNGNGSGSTDSESKIQELQSKLQGLLSRLAAAMQQGNEAEAGGIHGQISTVMAQIAALQASEG